MPLLATLLSTVIGSLYTLLLGLFGAKWAIRISAATAMASLYTICAISFSTMILPWLSAMLQMPFGYILGLLFPAVAGTVMASLALFWACILAKRYTVKMIKAVVGA